LADSQPDRNNYRPAECDANWCVKCLVSTSHLCSSHTSCVTLFLSIVPNFGTWRAFNLIDKRLNLTVHAHSDKSKRAVDFEWSCWRGAKKWLHQKLFTTMKRRQAVLIRMGKSYNKILWKLTCSADAWAAAATMCGDLFVSKSYCRCRTVVGNDVHRTCLPRCQKILLMPLNAHDLSEKFYPLDFIFHYLKSCTPFIIYDRCLFVNPCMPS
jgi:hypothetical protein